MIEYFPWSKKVLEECLGDYNSGELVILDIELGGQCNYHCIYCDSPCREKKCSIPINKLQEAFATNKIKWVFVCGLGEPTVDENEELLYEILLLCEKHGAKCSIFTNLSNLNAKLLNYIKKEILYVLFKYDSRDIVKNMSLYGVSNVNKQLYNIERLKKLVKVSNGCTNIAASIVPTRINKEDIINIVKDCIENNIYPLIAELENSGEAQEYYGQLSLTQDELLEIMNKVSSLTGDSYSVPVCPAVICGLHIRHDSNVTVDDYTGLSCHWFWLEEPKTKTIGDFSSDSIYELINNIKMYRLKKLRDVENIAAQQHNTVFGGCGGDVNYLLKRYLQIQEEQK